ncbi:MAG TPA: hypothetical protein VNO70_01485 [Blastocatellia bacterium]|nr:hypothetical protein [Blastocatellia bacterium]
MSNLSVKQQEAISALIVHPTARAASEALGVNPSTIWRWLQDPEFREAYDEARRLVVTHNVTAIQAAGQQAVMSLIDMMNDPKIPAHARVRASQVILDLGMKVAKLDELDSRLRAIEEEAEEL